MPVSSRTLAPRSESGTCRAPRSDGRPGLRLPALAPGPPRTAAPRSNSPRDGGGSGVEAAAVGDVQLQLDEVEAGGLLGDRMLDLQPGVHLEEEEDPPLTVSSAMNSTVPAPV